MRITGFSIWQARTARGDLTAQLFPGYAAIEQYGFEGQQALGRISMPLAPCFIER